MTTTTRHLAAYESLRQRKEDRGEALAPEDQARLDRLRVEAAVEADRAGLETPRVQTDEDARGDFFNADRFIANYAGRVHYVPQTKRWLVWNGAWWEEDHLGRVLQFARDEIDGLRDWIAEAQGKELEQRARHYSWSCQASRRQALLDVASTHRGIPVNISDLDRPRYLLACSNGTVNLQTGELLEPYKSDLITRGVDFKYDPDAYSERWTNFLATTFNGDSELIGYVQRLMGYAISGEVREHVLPIFWGTGANGKTTFLTAIQSVIGEHATTAPEGLLVEHHGGQPHPERVAALRGKRLVVSSELENRTVLAEGLVKSITGGDRISAREMYGRRFEFEPTHTIVLATNHAPKVRGTDEAIWRRLRMVPFTVTIPPADRIPDYGTVLAECYGDSVLRWLVDGAVEYYRGGLNDPQVVRDATAEYRKREDNFAQFLDEKTVAIQGRTKVSDLQAAWRDWATSAGIRVGRNQDFVAALEAHGIEVDSGRTSFASGVGILSETACD